MITFGTDDVTLAHYLINKGHNVVKVGKNFEFEITGKLCEDVIGYYGDGCSSLNLFCEQFKKIIGAYNGCL